MIEVMVSIIAFLFVYTLGFGVMTRLMGFSHISQADSLEVLVIFFWFVTLPCVLGYRLGNFAIRALTEN